EKGGGVGVESVPVSYDRCSDIFNKEEVEGNIILRESIRYYKNNENTWLGEIAVSDLLEERDRGLLLNIWDKFVQSDKQVLDIDLYLKLKERCKDNENIKEFLNDTVLDPKKTVLYSNSKEKEKLEVLLKTANINSNSNESAAKNNAIRNEGNNQDNSDQRIEEGELNVNNFGKPLNGKADLRKGKKFTEEEMKEVKRNVLADVVSKGKGG